jgi:hypothetical protein
MSYDSASEKSPSYFIKKSASNRLEGHFLMLKVYADETGTHDDADVVILSGLIETPVYWESFNRRWKGILDRAGAKYFHYREFRECANIKPSAPYYGWPISKRKKFIFKLAMLVGESAVPTGGMYPTTHNKKIGINNKPFDSAIDAFYRSTLVTLDSHWRNYTGQVLFVFDKSNNRKWTEPLIEIHRKFMDKDPRIEDIEFEDDKNPSHLALQAADLSAIHLRNETREYVAAGGGIFDMGIIDFIVSKNIDPQFRSVPKEMVAKIIGDMRKDEALKRRNGFTGAYIPIKHFDFKKYGYPK